MTESQLLERVKSGELLMVGEYRGGRAEASGYVDKNTGKAVTQITAIYLIECQGHGSLDIAIIRQHLPPTIQDPAAVQFPYVKGARYVFFLEGFRTERGFFYGWIGERRPELLEPETNLVPSVTTPPFAPPVTIPQFEPNVLIPPPG